MDQNGEGGGIAPYNLEGLSPEARAILEYQRIYANQHASETKAREEARAKETETRETQSTLQQQNALNAVLHATGRSTLPVAAPVTAAPTNHLTNADPVPAAAALPNLPDSDDDL